MRENKDAMDFIDALFAVLHLWDDLIDRDKKVGSIEINQGFWRALIVIPENKFYQAHFFSIMPLLRMAIFNWHVANQMEVTDSESDKRIAFVLRSAYVDLVTHCASLIGGRDWAIVVGEHVRRETSSEGFEKYLESLHSEPRVIDLNLSRVGVA